jgi:DNA-binding GntR family transcriptional regulator
MSSGDAASGALTPLAGAQSLSALVEQQLRKAILSGELAPGARLSVPELARRLGVSRTPVRDAVAALERAGLAISRPRLGALVSGGGRDELVHLYEVRGALDGLAARLAASRMEPAERRALREVMRRHTAAVKARDADAHVACDVAFHRLLRDGAHNPRLAEELARLQDQILLVLRATSSQPGAMGRGVLHDHNAIMRAVLADDPDAAEQAARTHVEAVLRFVLDSAFEPEVRHQP